MRQSDPFSKLPSPILLSIVKLSPDLPSFRSLENASPTVASLFNECAAEITEVIISTSLPEQIQILIRVVTAIRSNSVALRSLDEFIDTYLSREKRCRRPQSCMKCNKKPLSLKIDASTSPLVLRGVLDLASRIQRLTNSCLQTMIDRCMSLELSHLLDPEFRYIYRPVGKTCPQRRPLGQRYQQRDSGPPSWAEQERTCRAFWRVQLFFDLRAAIASRNINWPHVDTARLQSTSVEAFWEGENFGRNQHEQVRTVVEFLQDEIEAHPTIFAPPMSLDSLSQLPCTNERLLTGRPAPQLWKEFDLDGDSPGYNSSAGYSFIHDLLRAGSPMWKTDPTIFRRLGCYIWDIERLAALELINTRQWQNPLPTDVVLSKFNLWFTWESILSEEELAAKERRRINQFPERFREFGATKKASYWFECPNTPE